MASMLALFVAWGAFLASPYWALRDLAVAVVERDTARLADGVNFRALRNSMAKQLVTEIAAGDRSGMLGPSGGSVAAAALAAALDPLLEQMLTPDGVVGLLGAPSGGREPPLGAPLSARKSGLDQVAEFLHASSWRGFRNVYFTLPPGASRAARFRLQMRLGRLTWRLVGIELPPDSRRQVAQAVLARQRAAP